MPYQLVLIIHMCYNLACQVLCVMDLASHLSAVNYTCHPQLPLRLSWANLAIHGSTRLYVRMSKLRGFFRSRAHTKLPYADPETSK